MSSSSTRSTLWGLSMPDQEPQIRAEGTWCSTCGKIGCLCGRATVRPSSSDQAADNALVEAVSAEVHAAWMRTKAAQGVTSRRSETGEELMVPYAELSEPAKDLDRQSVLAVLAAAMPLVEAEQERRWRDRIADEINAITMHDIARLGGDGDAYGNSIHAAERVARGAS